MCAVVLAVPSMATAQTGSGTTIPGDRYVEAGWAAVEARDFSTALKNFDTALLARDPNVDTPRARAGRARALAGIGRTQEALRIIEGLAGAGPEFQLEHAAILLIAERPEPALSLIAQSERNAQREAQSRGTEIPRRFTRRAIFLRAEALYLMGGYAEAERTFARAADIMEGAAEWRGVGDSQFAQGKRDAADQSYARALELRRYDGMAMQRRARLKFLRGDHDGALADYSEAEVALDEDSRLLAEHAEALMAAGAAADAVAVLKRLLKRVDERSPEGRAVSYHLASALVDAGRAREAEAIIARIGSWPEASVSLDFLRGRALFARGDAEGAIQAYSRALAERPGEAAILFNRGLAWLQLDQKERALGDLAEASVRAPQNPEIRDAIGRIKLHQGRFEEGLAFYDAAVAAKPKDPLPLTQRANARLAVGMRSEALKDAQRALASAPGHLPAAEAAAKALIALDRPAEALPYAERLIKSRTMRRSGYLLRAEAAIASGDGSDALASIEQARNFGAPEWRIALLQGDAYMKQQEYEAAVRAYDRTITLNKMTPSVLARRGDAYFALGEFDRAADDYAAVLSRFERDIAHRLKRAEALRRAGRNQEAITEYDVVLASQPENDDAMYARGKSRIAMGSYIGGFGDMLRSVF